MTSAHKMQDIPIEHIKLSKTVGQVARRAAFKKTELLELTDSITAHGVLQPIIVRPLNGANFELVAGERRIMASKAANLGKIPAVVRELSDEQVIEVQLIENLQRKDLHPMQEAEGYHELMEKHGHAIQELYERVGKSRSYVYGRLKLLALCEPVRKAFYADKISASVALLIARIPVPKLQREALRDVSNPYSPVSYRRALETIQRRYMLRLKEATFSPKDADLVPHAGACVDCPKRTGNQPDLFGDVRGADVCTDPTCFASKTKAHAKNAIAAATAAGKTVITGTAAKKVAPYGSDNHIHGFMKLDDTTYHDPKRRKIKTIVGPDADIVLLQDPATGAAIDVVKESTVMSALRKGKPKQPKYDDGTAARRKKSKLERDFRIALYDRLRPKLKTPSMRVIAQALFDRLEHDHIKELCRIRDYEPPTRKGYGNGSYKDHRQIGKTVAKLPAKELAGFINDCIFARELQVPTWSNSKPMKLLAAAKRHRVSVASVRASVQPKKRKLKKKAAKKRQKRR